MRGVRFLFSILLPNKRAKTQNRTPIRARVENIQPSSGLCTAPPPTPHQPGEKSLSQEFLEAKKKKKIKGGKTDSG